MSKEMNWIGALLFCFGAATVAAQSCGVPRFPPLVGNNYEGDRIVGGKIAKAHSWPWQVSLQRYGPTGQLQHFCGGSLVSNQWVVTAGHCLVQASPQTIYIKLGKHNLNYNDVGEQLIGVVRIINHPSYRSQSSANDISMIKLSRPVTFSNTIQPVCMASVGQELAQNTMTHITGWGHTGFQATSQQLKQTSVPIVEWNRCKQMHYYPVHPGTICTGFLQGQHNPCFGDSGGPLVVPSGNTWFLHGVVSWGPQKCAIKEEPAVYTKVASFRPWIDQVMRLN